MMQSKLDRVMEENEIASAILSQQIKKEYLNYLLNVPAPGIMERQSVFHEPYTYRN